MAGPTSDCCEDRSGGHFVTTSQTIGPACSSDFPESSSKSVTSNQNRQESDPYRPGDRGASRASVLGVRSFLAAGEHRMWPCGL